MPAPSTVAFNREDIRPGDRICVAISGGADSVALLLAVHNANTAKRDALGIGLSAAHVHHGIRPGEADTDQQFIEELCTRLDVPLHIHKTSIPERVAKTGETVEEAARNVRYDYFASLIATGEADSILTAHTLDDQAETVLMKLLRGAWTEGLSAIHPAVQVPGARPGKILRPFLNTRRSEIEAYLNQLNQPWREDSTNTDTAYTRNRIRHELMPQLREYNPSLDQTLANLAELAREEEARWQVELNRLLPQVLLPGKPVRGGGRSVSTAPGQSAVAIELDRLRTLDPALRRRVLRAAARQLGARLSFDETSRLLALCGFLALPTVAARTGASLHLSNQLRAERSHRELRLFLNK
ncbi:MAG TPA: tRNA lysidine(34) synthetase TilS [Edaphobacter sp.]|uniref:tRNA lysidine(34) synthetase TilS n=1 Tax=Edaphobacter sp. TaxID=1934404 RepID=UPI002CA2F8F7|nr:tRNA lysidine(34) synthetase TilS [Edaphobacter sp.]HUZ94486.1 tRNA lysidine(34) synthetase TilS [Edaphobacter sp.]